MSLVAYAASSGEESDNDSEDGQPKQQGSIDKQLNGHISDEDEYESPGSQLVDEKSEKRRLFSLPAPKTTEAEAYEIDPDERKDVITPAFDKLPEPKPITDAIIEEEDDEFLHKKEKPTEEEKPPPPVVMRKGPVKITIPSLSEFKDLEKPKPLPQTSAPSPTSKTSGLLGLLPKPKHEILLGIASSTPSTSQQVRKPVTSLVPDSVKNNATRKVAPSTVTKPKSSKPTKKIALVSHSSDSEDSDMDGADFFSFNSKHVLPEVSDREIQAMVAKKATQIANAASNVDKILEHKPQHSAEMPAESNDDYETQLSAQQSEVNFDNRAIQALVGSRAKRQKMDNVNIVELSANDVLPDKDEWLRTALASSTAYQPKGVLVDEELTPGTRRKHQITYLAHQAKANELELQAMWSANRHTRRQTQGKYGF